MKRHELRIGPAMVGAGGKLRSPFVPFLQKRNFLRGIPTPLGKN